MHSNTPRPPQTGMKQMPLGPVSSQTKQKPVYQAGGGNRRGWMHSVAREAVDLDLPASLHFLTPLRLNGLSRSSRSEGSMPAGTTGISAVTTVG